MATSFIVSDNIAQNRMDLILSMFKSWNIDVMIEKSDTTATHASTLPFSAGLWTDYDINDRSLRSKAWGTDKRAAL